jgi:drug/metabolite transporter (DMT)-like permease
MAAFSFGKTHMDIRSIGIGLVFAFIWASAFTSARIIVLSAPPLTALCVRFAISGLIAIAIGLALKQSFRLTRAQWTATAIFGICQNALYLGLNFVAMQWIEASLAAIIASTMPLIVAMLAWIFLRERIGITGTAGLAAGVAGVALIMGPRLTVGIDFTGIVLCFIAASALAVATLLVRTAVSGGNLWMIVGFQMLIGSVILLPFATIAETPIVHWSPEFLAAFAYTVLIPGVAGTWLWFILVGRIGATRAATFHFLNPFFGVTVAAAILSETIGMLDIIGIIVIMLGILAVQLTRKRSTNASKT